LTEEKRQQIVDRVFGDEGLKPGLVKMFLDPHHQAEPGGEFDPESTTRWMRYFVREGLKRTRARGDDLQIITTLCGPPAWATKQKFLRGRDLDPARKYDLAKYMVDWVRYLREQEKLPVKYLSLHNEGEDWMRWPTDGKSGNIYTAKVNGIIPWACIQRPAKWVGGDPNPGTAFRVADDGTYEVLRGYYYDKLLSRAGQPGMAVARTMVMDSEVAVIAFARNGTRHADAFTLVNLGKDKRIAVKVRGSGSDVFEAYRTADEKDRYTLAGQVKLEGDTLLYEAPAQSATTFFAK